MIFRNFIIQILTFNIFYPRLNHNHYKTALKNGQTMELDLSFSFKKPVFKNFKAVGAFALQKN